MKQRVITSIIGAKMRNPIQNNHPSWWAPDVSQSEVLGQFYNPNTTPKDKERVVVCLRGTGQELH